MTSLQPRTGDKVVWVNGCVGAGVPGDDPGLLFGITAFETLRTYGCVPFRLDEHIERLLESARAMAIEPPSEHNIRKEILSACQHDVYIRFTLTGGGHRIMQRMPIEYGKIGRPVRVAQMLWDPPDSLPGAVKHGCRAAWILAAKRSGVDEMLLVDGAGLILEASRSNVFAVRDGCLWTPPLDGRQLVGVTRGALLEAARDAGITVVEKAVPLASDYDELYLASTLKELAPVAEIDGQSVHGLGPVGQRLHAAFNALVARETAL